MIRLVFTIIISHILVAANAQTHEWVRKLGNSNNIRVYDIAVDFEGSSYITGNFSDSIDLNPGTGISMHYANGNNIFILKLDSLGMHVWSVDFGANQSNADFGWDLKVGIDGDIYCTGWFYDSVDFDPGIGESIFTANGNPGTFLLKLSSDGNYKWCKTFSSQNSSVRCTALDLDSSDNIHMVGALVGTADFDPDTGIYNISGGAFISKFDSSGSLIWAKGYYGPPFPNEIRVDNNGNIYHTGEYYSACDLDPDTGQVGAGGTFNAYLVKLDFNGTFQWGFGFGSTGYDEGWGLDIDQSNNVYITGYFSGSVNFSPNSSYYLTSNSMDAFIAKYSSNGNLLWANAFGSNQMDIGFDLVLNQNNQLNCVGSFMGTVDFDPDTSIYNLTSSGQENCYLTRIDSANNFIGTWADLGPGSIRPYAMDLDQNENIFITGQFSGKIDFDPNYGSDTVQASVYGGTGDVFIHKLNPCFTKQTEVTITKCTSYTSPSGHIWTNSGIYVDTLTSQQECDSFLIVDLTIIGTEITYDSIESCLPISSPSGNQMWETSGNYLDTMHNVFGCDSILNINLTIHEAEISYDSIESCSPVLSPSGNQVWNTSGNYLDTLYTTFGCDSLILTHFEKLNSTYYTIEDTFCDKYESATGNVYYTSGVVIDTLINSRGCDSILTLNFEIVNQNPEFKFKDGYLVAQIPADSFQWARCDSTITPINNASDSSFEVLENGFYCLITSTSNCLDTSDCFQITTTNSIQNQQIVSNQFKLFPNPTVNYSYIMGRQKVSYWEIYSLSSKYLLSGTESIIDLTNLQPGVYLILISNATYSEWKRIVVMN